MAFRSYRASSFNFRQFGGASGGRVLQRRCACGNKAESEGTCDECAEKEGMLQRKSCSGRTGETPSIVYDVLRAPGQPLDQESQNFMEDRFGYDFSGVRVHSDEQAHRSAEATDAHAYTVGHDIVFASGRYSPSTSEGKELLAHELTHVVQQDSATPVSSGAITMGKVDEHETAADQTASAVVSDNATTSTIGPASVGLQRQPAGESEATEAKPAEQPCLEEVVGEDVPSLLQAGVLTVIEFGGTSCKPCQRLKAHLAEICQNFRVKAPPVTVRFYSLDLEVEGNEGLYDKYVPGGSVPHLYFYVGSTKRSHYDSAPEPDVLEVIMAEHIKYASTSGAARGAKKGLGWGALAGGLAGIGGAIAIGTQTNLQGNEMMGAILGTIAGGAAIGLGLGAAIGAIAGSATDDRDKGPKEQKRKKLQRKSASGDKDDEQERKADQTAKSVAAKEPELPKTRGQRAGIGAGIGAGTGAVVGGIVGLIAASQMEGPDKPYAAGAGIGGLIGGAVGAIVGSLIGYFMGYDEKVTNAAVADGLIRRRYGKYIPGGVGPLHNASVHLVTRKEICEKNACRAETKVDPSCGLLGWTDTGPAVKPGKLEKDQPGPIKPEDEPVCADKKQLEHATRERPVIYYTTDETGGTLIHEGLHAYGDKGIEMLHNHVNEGLTEYFTRQIYGDINMPVHHNEYDRKVVNVEKMVDLIGEDKFAEAYFGRGRVPQLHQTVNNLLGPCALAAWAFNLEMNMDMRADDILASRNVDYCKSKEIPTGVTPGDLTPTIAPPSKSQSAPTKQQPRE